MSVDPLATKFPHLTPYNFVENNPVNLVDPTGMSAESPEVFITGPDADKATAALNKKSNLNITRDAETGKLSATGTAETDADKKLLEAITNKKTSVTLNTVKRTNTFESQDGSLSPMMIGENDGSTTENVGEVTIPSGYDENGLAVMKNVKMEKTMSHQYINMIRSAKAERAGVSDQRTV